VAKSLCGTDQRESETERGGKVAAILKFEENKPETIALMFSLGVEGSSVRFDSRDIAAIATTMFIAANERGMLEPGAAA